MCVSVCVCACVCVVNKMAYRNLDGSVRLLYSLNRAVVHSIDKPRKRNVNLLAIKVYD